MFVHGEASPTDRPSRKSDSGSMPNFVPLTGAHLLGRRKGNALASSPHKVHLSSTKVNITLVTALVCCWENRPYVVVFDRSRSSLVRDQVHRDDLWFCQDRFHVVLVALINSGIDFESEAAAVDEQAPLTHFEQGLGRKRCLMAIAFLVLRWKRMVVVSVHSGRSRERMRGRALCTFYFLWLGSRWHPEPSLSE